jgi:photosystem II stability/assembly factor-like uncharacterized protein
MTAGIGRSLAAMVMAVACIMVGAPGGQARSPVHAAQDGAAWEQPGLAEHKIVTLSAPRSGALFAQTDRELWRSDDAGLSWRPVPLPNGIFLIPRITVDPHDHTTVYVDMAVTRNGDIRDQIMRSRDEGASWQMILPSAGSDVDPKGLIGSEAQSGLLYSRQEEGSLRRSEDGGDSWVDLILPGLQRPVTRMGCVDFFSFFPHPTNPEVIYRVGACRVNNALDAGAQLPYRADVSQDRGSTWSTLSPSPFLSPFAVLAGCGANAPSRLYLTDRQPDAIDRPSGAPAFLLRSDDGGQTWQQVRGGEESAAERIDRVACDPTYPDRVFLLRSEGSAAGIRVSQDGGRTWGVVGLPDAVSARDLAVGIDGRYLFLATDAGVWRQPLGR